MSTYNFDPQPYKEQILEILQEVSVLKKNNWKSLQQVLRKFPKDGKGIFSRDQLIKGYRLLVTEGSFAPNELVIDRVKMKPVRTISGVTPVTVLTKPFPCPGQCIYCPNDVRMPKSYLAMEPGAQRAERNSFDPYLQTYNRLEAFLNIGHNIEKVELIILGGTWSFYPEAYQIWFVQRCFEALNDFGVRDGRAEIKTNNIFSAADKINRDKASGRQKTYNEIISQVAYGKTRGFFSAQEFSTFPRLFRQQRINETAKCRCVGLVIETRPDFITEAEVVKIRKLGATKVQLGIQSLQDKIQKLNKRGHGARETAAAFKLLRQAGFKIHGHWMPNLFGSSPQLDRKDYLKLWTKNFRPDELKIYPTSIIANTELYTKYQQGEYHPYSKQELLEVLQYCFAHTPRYCRLTRVIRDIPSQDIIAGNKLSNLRQVAEQNMLAEGSVCQCIRCREIKNNVVEFRDLELEKITYQTSIGREIFLAYRTKKSDKIAGFLRLSLPAKEISRSNFQLELRNAAMIREVHVYGQVVSLGKTKSGKPQHLGIGSKLLQQAKLLAKQAGFHKIAVISAIGTREYYRKRGFSLDNLYMIAQT